MKYFLLKFRIKLLCILALLLFSGLDCTEQSLVTGDCVINGVVTRLNPGSVSLSQGETQDIEIEATARSNCQEWYPNNYSVEVLDRDQLSVNTCYQGDLSMNIGTCIVSVSVPQDLDDGVYLVVLNSVMSRDGQYSAKVDTLLVNVIPSYAAFTLSLSSNQIDIPAGGGSETVSVTINRTGGHSSDINLSLDNLPSGASYTFVPNPVSGTDNTSALTITTDQTVSSNSYLLIVNGNDGMLERNTGLQLTVGNPVNPWFQQISGVNENLVSVHFIDIDNGFIAGNNGTILKTSDGGVNWNLLLNPPPVVHFKAIQFLNSDHGYVIGTGGGIYFTQNGGASWQNKSITNVMTDQSDLYFFNQQNGWVVGRQIFFTLDGGDSWDLRYDYEPPRVWNSIAFSLMSNGIAVGSASGLGRIIYTTDNGINWTEGNYPSGIPDLYDVCFVNTNTAFAIGKNGYLLKSVDGGQNWNLINSNISNTTWGITFADELNGWIVGKKIWRTLDGGLSWSEEYSPSQTLYKSCFINNETGFAVGSSGLIMRRK